MRHWMQQTLRSLIDDSTMMTSTTSAAGGQQPRLAYSAKSGMMTTTLHAAWLELHKDGDTQAFLDGCQHSSIVTLAAHGMLRTFMSVTETNAWLGGGRMFVMSTEQVRTMLRLQHGERLGRLLDVGAGDGNVTARMAPLFGEVTATEVASGMIARLRAFGYKTVETADLDAAPELKNQTYDVVSLLNVLDRCDRPMTLLKQLKKFIKPVTGLLLIAVVFPFRPFVEGGGLDTFPSLFNSFHLDGAGQRQPTEYLKIPGLSFEDACTQLEQNVLIPAGYQVVTLSRVPYLSERYTNTLRPYCWLDDAIVVAKPI